MNHQFPAAAAGSKIDQWYAEVEMNQNPDLSSTGSPP
jgi:hypothetical protein